jgi:hypothetical protein
MNKAFYRIRCISSFLLIGCLILFNLSCGLDTFYVIDSPTNVVHQPTCDSRDYIDNYFDFWTADKEYESLKFLGTDVYYKIYTNSTRLKSEADDLINVSNRSDSTSAAAERMIQSYKFQPLRASGHEGQNVLFPTSGNNQRINIRLSTYTIYPAQITIDGGNSIGIPVRNLPAKPAFNFSAASATIPGNDDVDVNSSGTAAGNEWFVSMFAVAIGQDSTYSPIYSNVLYLGSVRIPLE